MKSRLLAVVLLSAVALAQNPNDWSAVTRDLGKAPQVSAGVAKVTFPRTDLKVKIGETVIEPAAGLTSWIALRREGALVIADGDLVLRPGEVANAIDALQNGGIEITGLHNHVMGEQPQVMYLHFFARGEEEPVLKALKAALPAVGAPAGKSGAKFPASEQKTIETALGKAGTVNGAVLAFSFPRPHELGMHGVALPPAMGMATAVNFQPSAKGVAATGDFVLRESEVNPVVKALRAAGITVTAIHNHLLDDNPRMVFVHFWAEGPAQATAQGLRTALDASTK